MRHSTRKGLSLSAMPQTRSSEDMSATTTTRTALKVLCFVICTFSYAEASLCVCGEKQQAGGSLVCDIDPTISDILQKSLCDGQLIIDGKVGVQYGHGRMENFTDPVKSASVYRFTVDESPAYAYIIAESVQDEIFINETCTYLQTDQDDPVPQGRHHIITVTVTLAFFTLAIIIIIITIALRKKCMFSSRRGHNESSFICCKLQTV
ncbi:uncharacterized protein LOC134444426 [Engraulis encrasicolus]|uniref:uncharacterized protein LOC134444426 n=1 Tax=Engraulis encrasicolus TaxID=184585 RepID=UPI002FD6A8E7